MNGVVFDMDGLLLDTENVFIRFFDEVGKEMGYDDVASTCKSAIGKNSQGTKEVFNKKYGENFFYDDFRKKASAKIYDFYEKNGMPIKKGAVEILKYFKSKNFKIALATSRGFKNAKYMLTKSNLYNYFDKFVFGEEISNGKPMPDIYIYACEKIGLKPSECYAFEDSINGVKSATLAGLKTIMIPDVLKPTEEIKDLLYAILPSLDCAIKLIEDEDK